MPQQPWALGTADFEAREVRARYEPTRWARMALFGLPSQGREAAIIPAIPFQV